MVADSAPAEGHNLGKEKHMGTWGRAGQGKGPRTASSGDFSPVQWTRSTSRARAQDMVQMCSVLPPNCIGTAPGASSGAGQHPPPPS